jgi:DNA-binding protein HU-beta
MTKQNLADKISKKKNLTNEASRAAIEGFKDSVKESLANGETVYLRGFGTFMPKMRKAKVARNINKGTSIPIPARNVPFFKPCKEFKKMVK